MKIIEFLLARLDEDEAAANDCPNPPRVLAECEAKRAIVEHSLSFDMREPPRHLAAVYADHPDYSESWRP